MFCDRLKSVRKQAGLTQQQAAEALNLSTRSYQRYEAFTGQCDPPIRTLIEIADLFDVSLDWLMCRDEFLAKHADERQ